jgi:hypothetical protein
MRGFRGSATCVVPGRPYEGLTLAEAAGHEIRKETARWPCGLRYGQPSTQIYVGARIRMP